MDTTSLTLLQRVKTASDSSAWKRFVELYGPLLVRWAQQAGQSESDAADTVQDIFVVLLRELPGFTYDQQRKNFRGWLKTLVINKVRDKQRKKSPDVISDSHLQELEQSAEFDALAEAEYQQMLITQALRVMKADFEEKSWQACWETTVHERSAKEVAAQLGMTEAAVFAAKSRVLRRLREELAGLIDG